MTTIQNVTVVGGSGNLGPAIVHALLDANFTVSVLTRVESSTNLSFPDSVRIIKTNYSSLSLEKAFQGQDAVVSTIATAALSLQKSIIDAAVQAGVKHYIPSEFGINTRNLEPGSGPEKILGKKIEVQQLLQTASKENPEFYWTGISTSMFFDWGLKVGSIGFYPSSTTATIWDSGNEPFTGTNLPTIGKAVAAVFKNPSKFADRYLEIASFVTTQNEILALFEAETGTKWTVTKATTEESQRVADEKLAKGDYSAFGQFLQVYLYTDGKGRSPKKDALAYGELGLALEDLRATIKSALQTQGK